MMRAAHVLGALATALLAAGVAGAQAASATPAAATVASAAAAEPKPAKLPDDSLEIPRQYTRWFYTAQADSLAAHSAPSNRTAAETKADILNSLAELTGHAGTETNVLEEKFVTRNGRRQYWRTAQFSDFNEPLLVRFVLDEKGQITGFGLGPKGAAPAVDP